MKNFVKALDKEADAFQYLKHIVPEVSDANLKEGMYVGQQFRKILRDEELDQILSVVELAAWVFFKRIASEFLGDKEVKGP